jgi:hypothetical protein
LLRKAKSKSKKAKIKSVEIVQNARITATVTSNAANIRSEPDSSKNNVIIQAKSGDILMVTGPVEKGWFTVDVVGKPCYVSS